MLNTSLHNPCVKEKTTLDHFISMNRGINNGENLPDDLLSVSISINLYMYQTISYTEYVYTHTYICVCVYICFFNKPKHRHYLLCVYYVSPAVNCSEILLRPTIFIPFHIHYCTSKCMIYVLITHTDVCCEVKRTRKKVNWTEAEKTEKVLKVVPLTLRP